MMQKARTDLPLGGEDGLPEGNSPIRTVCFTGHRQIDPAHAVLLPALLDAAIRELYGRGARVFRAGGAIGFDTVAALKVLDLTPVLPGLELEPILKEDPYLRKHTSRLIEALRLKAYQQFLDSFKS